MPVLRRFMSGTSALYFISAACVYVFRRRSPRSSILSRSDLNCKLHPEHYNKREDYLTKCRGIPKRRMIVFTRRKFKKPNVRDHA